MKLLPMNKRDIKVKAEGQKSSPAELVGALHAAFGEHHARAVHAKGIILEGTFKPSREASEITKAFHLQKETSKVIVRFSDFTGIPSISDSSPLANPRGFAIKFQMNDGRSTDIVGHSFNGFPTANSDQFKELLLAIATSGEGAESPTALDKFLESHPIAKTFLTTQKNPSSYASMNYFGVNSFKFTNNDNESVFVRYQFLPENGEDFLSKDQMTQMGNDYLQDEIRKRISKGAFRFQFYAQLAAESDKIEDPSIAWPSTRKVVQLGIIEIEKISDNSTVADNTLVFIPSNLPEGIETADPMLDLRGAAYPISFKERN
ncbi:MAG: catalase family peroxidase [Sporocytophaga sp.]|uniref:catalase family peroxidase n=1 Tax=Sporocytophaga sp. TaxID=2231183 RepID=UPI001B1CFAB6|nr:catalase family peroxidase [Sporocytophaga sp.]MBO9699808.1 catalase family peroxidase [Sporocytophaga sp.]